MMGVGQLRLQCCQPTIPITLPWQRGFSRGGKKEEYAKPRTEGRELSYRKIGLMTVAVTQDLLSGMPLVLKIEFIHLWNSLLPDPGQPSAQLSKLIHLTACKKAMHAKSRWYRTVYIPCLVASYNMHKGKRWLNSNPPNHRGKNEIQTIMLLKKMLKNFETGCAGLGKNYQKVKSSMARSPFGSCLPGTELLQSPFRMEFSMGSLSLRYRQSLQPSTEFPF